MGRHEDPVWADQPPPPRRTRPVVPAVLAVVLIVLGGLATPAVLPGFLPGLRGQLPWFPAGANCTHRVVEVVTVPLAEPIVRQVIAGVQNQVLPDGECLRAQVRSQAADETVASSSVLPANRAPQVWVSDSSVWMTAVARRWKLQRAGSLGSSPVVIASSAAAIQRLGWNTKPPTWRGALSGTHPVAGTDLATHAEAALAMQALWQSAGKGTDGEKAVAAAVLVAGRTRIPDGQTANQLALSNDPTAPLITTSELAMIGENRDSTTARLTAVYPSEGSPSLDFPVLRVSPDKQDTRRAEAATAVLSALTGGGARAAARAAGLRDADGSQLVTKDAGVSHGTVAVLPALPAAVQAAFFTRLNQLAAPSRILAVIDVSLSMQATAPGTGLPRIKLAGAAAAAAGELLTDASSVGLWAFAQRLDGDRPYQVIVPVAPLGGVDGDTTHRAVVNSELARLDTRLVSGGTGVYETALAAVRAMRSSYDPRAVNTVVLFTDGTNGNSSGMTLEELVADLAHDAAAAVDRPVRLVGIGMGNSVDMKALQAMVAPTKGAVFKADTPAQMQQALYQLIATRG